MTDSYTGFTDHELLVRIAGRDAGGYEALFERYAAILFSVTRKILENDREAGKALLDIFKIIWEKTELYDQSTKNAYCWLILLARNKAVDIRRRKTGTPELPDYTEEYENKYIVPHLSSQIDSLDLKTGMKIKGNLENALSDLTDAQQYVIYLAFYAGYTQTQIAEELNIPFETVRTKIRQALRSFRDNLLEGEI